MLNSFVVVQSQIILLTRFNAANSVELASLKSNCSGHSKLLVFKHVFNCLKMMYSKIFEIQGSNENER